MSAPLYAVGSKRPRYEEEPTDREKLRNANDTLVRDLIGVVQGLKDQVNAFQGQFEEERLKRPRLMNSVELEAEKTAEMQAVATGVSSAALGMGIGGLLGVSALPTLGGSAVIGYGAYRAAKWYMGV